MNKENEVKDSSRINYRKAGIELQKTLQRAGRFVGIKEPDILEIYIFVLLPKGGDFLITPSKYFRGCFFVLRLNPGFFGGLSKSEWAHIENTNTRVYL